MKKLFFLLCVFFVLFLGIASAVNLSSCGTLGTAGASYLLTQDVSSNGTCFTISADNITLDLGAHTVTYDNSTPVAVSNYDFEQGSGSNAFNWVEGAKAQWYAGDYYAPSVWSGTHSMRFSLPSSSADAMAVSEGTFTLQPGTQYALTGMYYNGVSASISGFVELLDSSGNTIGVRAESKKEISNRGFTYFYKEFTVSSTQAVKIRFGVAATDLSSLSGSIYFDNVRITTARYYGVYVNGANAKITNGTINQGGEGIFSHALLYDKSTQEISYVNSTVRGVDSSNIKAEYRDHMNIHHNKFWDNAPWVIVRDWGLESINIIHTQGSNLIHDNEILASPQYGIRVYNYSVSTSPSFYTAANITKIYNNTIKLNSVVTQGFAIGAYLDGAEIYGNTIDVSNGRGIHVSNVWGNTNYNVSVHDNVITVQEGRNQEYRSSLTTYGIQIEDAQNAKIYNNTITAKTHPNYGNAAALRITGAASGSEIYNNTFTAIRDPAHTTIAASLWCYGCNFAGANLYNNTFESNNQIIKAGEWYGGQNTTLRSSTLKKGANPTEFYTFYFNNDNSAFSNNFFIDTALVNGASFDSIYDAISVGYDFEVKWYLDFYVKNSSAQPISGASISVKDSTNTIVFSGTTDASGYARAELKQFKKTKSSKTTYTPHSITITKTGYNTYTSSITMDSTKTLNIDLQSGSANLPPSVSAGGPYSGVAGTAIAISGTASDSDGTISTLNWTTSSSDCTIGSQNKTGIGTASATDSSTINCTTAGTKTLTLTATDNKSSSSTSTASVTVSAAAECTSGQTRACTTADGCAGTQTCSNNSWGACVKTNLCCGINCDDGVACTADSCSNGNCSHTAITSCSLTSDSCCPTACTSSNDIDCAPAQACGANLALNKTVSSNNQYWLPASNLVNGTVDVLHSYWSGYGSGTPPLPHYVVIDLGADKQFNKINVMPFGKGERSSAAYYFYPAAWNVKFAVSAAPTSWINFSGVTKTAGAGTLGTGISITGANPANGLSNDSYKNYTFTFTAVNARYIKYEVTSGDDDGDSDGDELEAYNCTQQQCTDGQTQSCVVGSCAGTQTCTSGAWGDCVKNDLCCGLNCDDANPCTNDSCSAGVCSHVPNTACSMTSDGCCPSNCSSANDADCQPSTPACGDGIIDAGENCENCPADVVCASGKLCCSAACISPACKTNLDCNDNNSSTDDFCDNPNTCAASCSHVPISNCGNKIIDVGENCSNCPQDIQCASTQLCCSGFCITPICTGSTACADTASCTADSCLNASNCSSACYNTETAACSGSKKSMSVIVGSPLVEGTTFTVTVVNPTNNRGISSAQVTYGTQTNLTNSSGKTSFVAVFNQKAISVSKDRYLGIKVTVYVLPSIKSTVSLKDSLGIVAPQKVIAGEAFEVLVVDSSNNPIANAIVSYNEQTTVTDESGKAVLTGEAGLLELSAYKTGFAFAVAKISTAEIPSEAAICGNNLCEEAESVLNCAKDCLNADSTIQIAVIITATVVAVIVFSFIVTRK